MSLSPDQLVSTPVAPASRLGAIDALRGLALLGVLTINLETEFRVSIFAQFLSYAQRTPAIIDRVLEIFIDLKAFAVFALYQVGSKPFSAILAVAVLVHYVASYDRVAWLLRA